MTPRDHGAKHVFRCWALDLLGSPVYKRVVTSGSLREWGLHNGGGWRHYLLAALGRWPIWLMRACSLVCCAACPVLMYTHKNRCASFSARVYTHEWKLSFYTRVGVYTVTVCTKSHMSFQREFLMRQEASIATFQIKIVLTINQVRWQ